MHLLRRLTTVRSAAFSTGRPLVGTNNARAYFLSEKLLLDPLIEGFPKQNLTQVHRDFESVIAQLPDNGVQPRFISYFKYGSMVFVNCTAEEAQTHLDALPDGAPVLSEELDIKINPAEDGIARDNSISVSELDLKAVDAITQAMAQAVTVSYHESEMDRMMKTSETLGYKNADGVRGFLNLQNEVDTASLHYKTAAKLVNNLKLKSADARFKKISESIREMKEMDFRWGTVELKEKFLEPRLDRIIAMHDKHSSVALLMITVGVFLLEVFFALEYIWRVDLKHWRHAHNL